MYFSEPWSRWTGATAGECHSFFVFCAVQGLLVFPANILDAFSYSIHSPFPWRSDEDIIVHFTQPRAHSTLSLCLPWIGHVWSYFSHQVLLLDSCWIVSFLDNSEDDPSYQCRLLFFSEWLHRFILPTGRTDSLKSSLDRSSPVQRDLRISRTMANNCGVQCCLVAKDNDLRSRVFGLIPVHSPCGKVIDANLRSR